MRILLYSLLALLAACGGSSGVSLDDAPGQFAHAACAKMFACCDGADRAALFGENAPADVADCEQKLGLFTAVYFGQLRSSQQAGRGSYDGGKAGACVDAIDASSCSEFDPENPSGAACEAFFTGKVADGGDCAIDDDCAAAGSFCKQGGGSTASGTCTVRPGVGGACTPGECTPGNYCKSGMCAALEADGGECFDASECQSGFCDQSLGVARCGPSPVTCDGA